MGDPALIVYTGGTFDLFHAGHVTLLSACRGLAGPTGRVVVALNTDEFVEAYKHLTPTHKYAQRRAILRAQRDVDLVVCNTGNSDSKVAIEVVQPDFIAVGEDWQERDYHGQMGFTPEWLVERGIALVYVKHLQGFSSTAIRKALGS